MSDLTIYRDRHTPGPWHDDGYRIYAPTDAVDKRNGRVIVEYKHVDDFNPADAALITAAPDLLSALKRVLAGFDANAFQRNTDGDGNAGWAIAFMPHLMALADAVKAIKKAEGE